MLDRYVHACSEEALLQSLASGPGGLTEGEAARRLEEYGENLLSRTGGLSALGVLADQLRSVVVLLLVAAAATWRRLRSPFGGRPGRQGMGATARG